MEYMILLKEFLINLVQILAAMVMTSGALYTGIALLDLLTPGINEWKQIKKGNLAVGVLYAAVMSAMIILIAPRILEFLFFLQPPWPVYFLVVTILNYAFALLAATTIIFLTIHLIDRLTPDLDEMGELEKGNVAMALIMSVALLSVIYLASFPLESAFDILKLTEHVI